jgi:branched-chain amino acid transport system permease protein
LRTLAAIIASGAALAALPWLGLPAFHESFLYLVFHWIVLATSWNILSGYSGYFSFGHGAFFGAGVYATATLATRDMPFLATLPLAALAAALLGLALGAVAFRVRGVRGELFALLTLAVTFVVATIVQNTPLDGGPGVYLSAVPVPSLAPTPSGTFYLLALGLATLAIAVAYVVRRSALGLALFAIHDDEDAAEVVGVPTYRCKLVAFAVGCALAGAAGGVHALFVSYVTVGGTFNITVPLTVVLMSVLGGTRHWAGPALGAVLITVLLYAFTAADQAVVGRAIVGVVLILAVVLMPQGVLGRLAVRFHAPVRRGAMDGAIAANDAAPAAAATHGHDDGAVGAAGLASAPALLEVTGLAKSFAGVQALCGVDVTVREGEILGVIGPNGSGKSTLINVISGHYRADAGRIVLAGRDVTHLPAHRIARSGVARTYQVPRPFAHLALVDNAALASRFGAAALPAAQARDAALGALAFTGLASRATALPGALNLHQTKFLELARALAARPRLLLLDEVLSGLAPAEIDAAVALVRCIRAQGTTIVLVEHVMRAVTALADRVVVLDQGSVLAEGRFDDVMARTDVALAYLGHVPELA